MISTQGTKTFQLIIESLNLKHKIAENSKHSYTFAFYLFQNEALSLEDDSLSSLSETSFNYINSIVGSGVIGIPYALVRAGYGVGLILLIFVAVITDYSLRLMVNQFDFN